MHSSIKQYQQSFQNVYHFLQTDIYGFGRKVPNKTRKHQKRPSPRQGCVRVCIQRHLQKPRHERCHRRCNEDATAGSTRAERPSIRSNRLQSRAGQVGQRSAAVRLQSLLHGATGAEYTHVVAAPEYRAVRGGLHQSFGFGAGFGTSRSFGFGVEAL